MGRGSVEGGVPAYRQVERWWNRTVWLSLFGVAVVVDVLVLFYPALFFPPAPVSAFFGGVYSGLSLAGLVVAVRRD